MTYNQCQETQPSAIEEIAARVNADPTDSDFIFGMKRYHYGTLRQRAERVAKMRNDRARKLIGEAGLGTDYLGIMPHNAMIGYTSGKPWAGIDYQKVRECLYVLSREFEASDALRRLYKRVGPDAFDWS